MSKHKLKHIAKPSSKHTTLYYVRRWRKAVAEQAKAAGRGSNFKHSLGLDDSAPYDQLYGAWVVADRAYESACRTLASLPRDGVLRIIMPRNGKRGGRQHGYKVPSEPLLAEVLAIYHSVHPEQDKALTMRTRAYNGVVEHIGNRYATKGILDDILRGLDAWQEARLRDGVSPAGVERERNSAVAVLRWWSKRQRYGWNIELQDLPKHTPKVKVPLTHTQQHNLLDVCLADDDATSAMLLAMLQGGMMPSEIARLDPTLLADTLALDEPFLVVNADTKTKARKRVVPIVVGVELIRLRLPEAVARSANAKDPAASTNKRLKARSEQLGVSITGHALRHTFRTNCLSAGVDGTITMSIGGWSGSIVNPIMLDYGAEGLAQSEVVKRLREASTQIHQHLLQSATHTHTAD